MIINNNKKLKSEDNINEKLTNEGFQIKDNKEDKVLINNNNKNSGGYNNGGNVV